MGVTPPQINAKVACSGPLEPTNSARRGHTRTVPHAKMSSKGRTELQINLPRAKNVKEAAGDVRFFVFPQKTGKHSTKMIFSSKFAKFSVSDGRPGDCEAALKEAYPELDYFVGPAGPRPCQGQLPNRQDLAEK